MDSLSEKTPTILDAEPLTLGDGREAARLVTDGDSLWIEPLDAEQPVQPASGSRSSGPRRDRGRRQAVAARRMRLVEGSRELARTRVGRLCSALDWRRWIASAISVSSSAPPRGRLFVASLQAAAGAAGRRVVPKARALAGATWHVAPAAGRAAPATGCALLFLLSHLLVASGRRLEAWIWQIMFATTGLRSGLGRFSGAAAWQLAALARIGLSLIRRGVQQLLLAVAGIALLVERIRQPKGPDGALALASVPGYRGGGWAREQLRDPPVAAVPLLASIGVAALAWLILNTMLPTLFQPFQVVEVPTLTNRTLGEATDLARAFGLEVNVASSQPTDDVPKDLVIGQVPDPGGQLRRGGAVKLTVSAGLRPPDLVGQPLDQARVLLVRSGWFAAPDVESRPTSQLPPGDVVEQHPGPQEAAPQKGPVKLVVAIPNLSQGKAVLTSAGGRAPAAVDGDEESVAWVPGGPPTWIEVNFGGPVTIAEIRLLLAQEVPGPSVIELWGWDVNGRFVPLYLFNQETSDHALLTARLPQPVANIVRLRAATTSSPSPIGWREIAVLDR